MPISDPVFTKKVHAGRRRYFVDVIPTRNGNDFFVRLTESKRNNEAAEGEPKNEKHRIFIYKEDFNKVLDAIDEAVEFAENELGKVNAIPKTT